MLSYNENCINIEILKDAINNEIIEITIREEENERPRD